MAATHERSLSIPRLISMLNRYLERSSLHGLQYLTSTHPKFKRFIWIVIISSAFSCCFLVVRRGLLENERYPLETTTYTIPNSQLNFPAFTVKFPDDDFAPGKILEFLLNYFTFDCKNLIDSRCQRLAGEVKSFFEESLNITLVRLLENIDTKLQKVNATTNFAKTLLCRGRDKNWKEFRAVLANYYNNNASLKAVSLLKEHLLSNYYEPQNKVIANLVSIIKKGVRNDKNAKSCWRRVRLLDNETQRTFMKYLLALEGRYQNMQWGRLLFSNTNFEKNSKKYKFLVDNLLNVFCKHHWKNCPEAMTRFWNCQLTSSPHKCPLIQLQGLNDHTKISNSFVQSFNNLLNFNNNEFDKEMATLSAQELGLNPEIIQDQPIQIPAIWLCKFNNVVTTNCSNFRAAFTNKGIGFTFDPSLNWKPPIMTSQLNLETRRIEHDLKADDSLTLYIWFPQGCSRG